MAVMMQAFYWDAPAKENKHGEWWNFVAEKVPALHSYLFYAASLRRPAVRLH